MKNSGETDAGLSELLPVICISVVMLPACVLAVRIISQVSVAVHFTAKRWEITDGAAASKCVVTQWDL